MKFSTIVSLVLSVVLAGAAVLGVRGYLRDQAASLAMSGRPDGPKEKNTVVVAAQPMRFGQIIEPMSLKVIDWPADTIPEGAFHTVEELTGDSSKPRYVMTAIEQSEPVLATKITGPGQRATLSATLEPGMKAISIRVNDVLGVAGFVLPGDRVDIMLTRQIEAQGDARKDGVTDVLLQGVKVLAVDQLADDRSDKPAVSKSVTLEVSTAEAQKLTLAATVGTLSLALRNVGSAEVEPVPAISLADLGGSMAATALEGANKQTDGEERVADVERLVRKMGETIDQKVGDVDERLNRLKQKIDDPKPSPDVVPSIVAAEPSSPVTVGVGVYRNAERQEYQVKTTN
ncbi:MAG: Flp pilus assembly protein CpaB [Mesorhizobium sp.]